VEHAVNPSVGAHHPPVPFALQALRDTSHIHVGRPEAGDGSTLAYPTSAVPSIKFRELVPQVASCIEVLRVEA